ncbi:hypothetical protein [Paenibacillus physcomitrellae]|uniref:GRAM domain-containing protein n=1 Tax=Paenibacillus physcomitrellae TaxID=1619311 RepID=A0ABQ1FQ34_9BACL|nr:hypothetical protein [Paenibacillus physcomitrellae]GGA24268.1 hypothetical protein GCM10010917_06380 [Paenibacillus physcomitrellae]
MEKRLESQQTETVLYQGQADYWKSSKETYTGQLTITGEAVTFRIFKGALMKEELDLRVSELQGVKKRNSFFLIPNKVSLTSGSQTYLFRTMEQEKIYQVLLSLISTPKLKSAFP